MPLSQPLVARSRATVLFGTAGAALLAAQALLPALPSGIARQVAVAAGHRGGEAGSAVAFLLAAALLVLAAAATNRLDLTRGRALTRVGLVLTGIGALWPAVGRASYNAILVALTGNGDRSVAVSAVHTISGSGAFAMFLILLLAFVTGPIVLALGLRRAGLLPIWVRPGTPVSRAVTMSVRSCSGAFTL